jgi:DNA-binding IclR family transcriptional regulator
MLNLALVEDYFTRTHQEVMSKSSFHRSIRELLDKKFIAESAITGLYFINPHLFFNGDRVRFVQEFKRKRANDEHAQLKRRLDTEYTIRDDPRQVHLIPHGGK